MTTVFLTATEVASILRISKALSYRIIKKGEIQSVRFGRTVRVKKEDLDAFIVRNASGSGASLSVSSGDDLHVTGNSREVTMH